MTLDKALLCFYFQETVSGLWQAQRSKVHSRRPQTLELIHQQTQSGVKSFVAKLDRFEKPKEQLERRYCLTI